MTFLLAWNKQAAQNQKQNKKKPGLEPGSGYAMYSVYKSQK
jgi:hypothetical protein